jgi:hypothetical protein
MTYGVPVSSMDIVHPIFLEASHLVEVMLATLPPTAQSTGEAAEMLKLSSTVTVLAVRAVILVSLRPEPVPNHRTADPSVGTPTSGFDPHWMTFVFTPPVWHVASAENGPKLAGAPEAAGGSDPVKLFTRRSGSAAAAMLWQSSRHPRKNAGRERCVSLEHMVVMHTVTQFIFRYSLLLPPAGRRRGVICSKCWSRGKTGRIREARRPGLEAAGCNSF